MRLIDADALKKMLAEEEIEFPMIDDQPTVDADPVRHGRWEKVRGHQMVRRCSECGDIMPIDRAFIHYIYCGHCGARMDSE